MYLHSDAVISFHIIIARPVREFGPVGAVHGKRAEGCISVAADYVLYDEIMHTINNRASNVHVLEI